jgi:hypothetical protein
MKVISGAQTGADVAGLFVAKKMGFETGGLMPKGFITLNGPRPEYAEMFGVREHTSSNYAPRTYANVASADGTIRLAFDFSTTGEVCTFKAITQYKKPYIDVDLKSPRSVEEVIKWISDNNIKVLNVAGNSEKTHPGTQLAAGKYLKELFELLAKPCIDIKQEKEDNGPKGALMDSKVRLEQICERAMKTKCYGDERYAKVLKEEFYDLEGQNECDYFLGLYDNKARYSRNEHNLLIPWLLDLVPTYDIEKPSASTMGEFPDIDVDYLPMVRDYLKHDWASKTFGQENVCEISSYTTFGIKGSLIDMARVHGKDRDEVLNLTTKLGLKDDDGKVLTWDKALELYPELKEYCDRNKDVAEAARKLLHRNRGMGVHAGGLIISNSPIDMLVPLVKSKGNDVGVSAFVEGLHGTDLGPLGLIKFDLLVITNLMQIALACKTIKDRFKLDSFCARPGFLDWSDTAYLNDPKALALANEGKLKGIFQFDSPGIRELVKLGGVDSFEDLVAYSALYRPGPMGCCEKNTKVYTKEGWKAIEKLEIFKDEIAYVNSDGKLTFTKKFLKTPKQTKKLLKIKLKNGKTIVCSPEHKFLIEQNKFAEAKDLKKEMKLACYNTI